MTDTNADNQPLPQNQIPSASVDALKREVELLRTLNESGLALASAFRLGEDELLELVYEQVSRLTNTDSIYIALYDERTDIIYSRLVVLDDERVDASREPGWESRKAGQGLTEEIILTRKPILHRTREEADAWYAAHRHEEYIGRIASSWMGAPMTVGSKVLGVIAVFDWLRENVYDEIDLQALHTLATQTAIALDDARMFYDVNQRFQTLAEFGRVITYGIRLHEEKILELIHYQASKLMDTDNMYIALYEPDPSRPDIYDQANPEQSDIYGIVRFGLAFVDGQRVDVETEGWLPRKAGKGRTEEIIRTKKPIFIATRAEAEAWYARQGHQEYIGSLWASWLGVPIIVGGKVLGVIATYHPTEEFVYSGDDLEILQALANQAAIALVNVALYERVEKYSSQLETVQEIANAIVTELNPQACMERILDEMMRLLDASYATIQLLDEATDELVVHAQRGVAGRRLAPELQRTKIGEGVTGRAAQNKWTIRLGNVHDVEYYLGYIEDTRSEMATPLIERGKVIGVLNVENSRENAFDEEDEDLFKLLAEQVVIAVQNAREVERRVEAERFEYLGLPAGGVAHRVDSKGSY